jgi:5'-3' exonuclease
MKDRILVFDFLNYVYRGVLRFGKPKPTDEELAQMSPKEQEVYQNKIDYTIVYNFFRNLRATIEEFEPDKCFFALEGDPQFRKQLFPDYKKNRIIKLGTKKAADKQNILRQADIICNLLPLLPVTMVRAAAYEADDVMHTLATNLKDEEVIIISSDSDMIQTIQHLSTYDVKLFNPKIKDFVQVPEYVYLVWKSIAGDTSDSIPSILSKEKATICATDGVALKEFLASEENRANFSLNKNLIELQLVPDDQLIFTECKINFDSLFEEFKKLEFFSLIKEDYKEKFIHTFTDNLK